MALGSGPYPCSPELPTRIHDHSAVRVSGYAEAPIGVFDSGVGGLTILAALRDELPGESYVYFGDSAHFPYGMRSDSEIIELSTHAGQFLLEQGVKLLVVACNTASLAALDTLRTTFHVPLVGVVPAVEAAVRATKNGRIGIAVTNHAAQAPHLRRLIDEFAQGIQVHVAGCSELVALVEDGKFAGPAVEQAVKQALTPMLMDGVDVIVLGCTHFPALRPVVERIAGCRVKVVDSTTAVARRTHRVLAAEALIQPATFHHEVSGTLEVWCSGEAAAFSTVASKLLGSRIVARQTTLQGRQSGTLWV